jgi:hypothetical protein
MSIKPKLSDFPIAIIACAGQFSGADKPHPYLLGETSFVGAWTGGLSPPVKERKLSTIQFQ